MNMGMNRRHFLKHVAGGSALAGPGPPVFAGAGGARGRTEEGHKRHLLPSVGRGRTAQRIGPGFLGMMYAPFTVKNAGQPPANIKAPGGLGSNEQETMERLRRRQRLFYTVEDNFAEGAFPHLKSPAEREAAGS